MGNIENYTEDLVERLLKRATIRRQISTRKSVQEGKPDRISNLLEEAAWAVGKLWSELKYLRQRNAERSVEATIERVKNE